MHLLTIPLPSTQEMDSPIPRLEDIEYRASYFSRNDSGRGCMGRRFLSVLIQGWGRGCVWCWRKQRGVRGVRICARSKKTARATNQRTQYEEAFVEAFYTAANYGFMVLWMGS